MLTENTLTKNIITKNALTKRKFVVALGFENVLFTQNDKNGHQSSIINIPGALEALHYLKMRNFEFHIVHYCNAQQATQIINLLEPVKHLFKSINFVKKNEHKGTVCTYYGCDAIIENDAQVLDSVVEFGPDGICLLLFGDKSKTKTNFCHYNVINWGAAVALGKNLQGLRCNCVEIPKIKTDLDLITHLYKEYI